MDLGIFAAGELLGHGLHHLELLQQPVDVHHLGAGPAAMRRLRLELSTLGFSRS